MIFRGGHARKAGARNFTAALPPGVPAGHSTSLRKSSGEISFAKLHRPLAVMRTFEPSRALRSIKTEEILL